MSAVGKLAPIAAAVATPYLGRGAGNTYFPGDLAEVLVYTRALSAAERVEVENYLRARYLPGQLPGSRINNPTNQARFIAPANISIAATPSGSGEIRQVEFYANDSLIGQRTNAPYSLTWSNVAPGVYRLAARAIDAVGAAALSDSVSVTVDVPSPLAPVLSQVANQSLIAGATLSLAVQAQDPNAPPFPLRFDLAAAPAGAAIHAASGLLSWRPRPRPGRVGSPLHGGGQSTGRLAECDAELLGCSQRSTFTLVESGRPGH